MDAPTMAISEIDAPTTTRSTHRRRRDGCTEDISDRQGKRRKGDERRAARVPFPPLCLYSRVA
ncbi:uncharacterized protein G2W53_041546 [Senna tora]|uniref:Uncharacterized protein n=1 Tax=Senna tora TaxID=362788 RepID=A0A834SDW9_9FABA|nr:uncharacterized protein G2W53_041546 [Senna tora]